MLVEGESLLNDGTAIVFFVLVLGIALGTSVTAGEIAVGFVKIVGAGVLVGTAVGIAVSKVIQRIDDPMIEITLTTIAAYGSFMVAEQLHFSGVIATVTAGMLCGNYGARTGMSPATRVAAETFWEYVAFALNSIVFLLIGLEVQLRHLVNSWQLILIAYLAMTLGRGAVIFGVSGLLRATRERLPKSWSLILAWGGLRGALSMVLALSLPGAFPGRDLVVTMTFGVVLLSILVQGLTMAPLLRGLGIVSGHEARAAYDFARGRLQAADTALREVEEMRRTRSAPPEVLAKVQEEYERRIQEVEKEVQALPVEREEIHRDELRQARRHLLLVEKERILEAHRQGTLDPEANGRLMADVDSRLLRLESGDSGEPEGDDAHRSPRGKA
jgi:CPA1 family monovalent cation:H+ antiporter